MVPATASPHPESSRTEIEKQRQDRLAREADAVTATEPDLTADRYNRTLRALAGIDAGRPIDDAAIENLVGPEEPACGRAFWRRPGSIRTSTARPRSGPGGRWYT